MLQNNQTITKNNIACLIKIKHNCFQKKNEPQFEYFLNNISVCKGKTKISINIDPYKANVELFDVDTDKYYTAFSAKFQQFTYDHSKKILKITGIDSKPNGSKIVVHLYF